MGSSVLIVDDNELDLTTQTKVRPKQIPARKKDVCDEMRRPRLSEPMGSEGSRASSVNVCTDFSASTMRI